MCGIAGLFSFRGRVERETLRKAGTLLRHRGPDEHGIHISGNIGLYHARLSIIDLETGRQPLRSPDGKTLLVANGEIYNFKELRERLELKGRRFSTRSDCEVILQAYLEYGDAFMEKITGMFAFALWDGRKRRLVLARDRMGIKPLYYTSGNGMFAFASEIKALTPLLPGTPRIHPGAMVETLQNQFSSGENTLLEPIKRVLPGEMITVDDQGRLKKTSYWSPLSVRPRSMELEEAKDVFSRLFDEVMIQHMRSDVPYGLFLSGGVDSATVLAMLDRLQSRRLTTFSVGFSDVEMEDELDDAGRMARLFGTDHVPVNLTRKQAFLRIPHMIWTLDEFMWDYACLPTSFLAEAAREHGLKVVFTGEGGDEVFAGYSRYRKALPERLLKLMVSPASGGFRTRGRWRRPWPRVLFGPKLRGHTSCFRRPFSQAWRSTPGNWDFVRKAQFTDMETGLVNDLLVKVDRMLMAFGVEGRVPFLDHRVVEFGLSLPKALKVMPHQGKVFLKRWAEDYLPREHLWKKKRGFHVPVGEWFHGRFLDRLEEKLLGSQALDGWFNRDGIKRLFSCQRDKGRAGREIWGIMHFAIWYRLFIEAPSRFPSTEEDPLDFIS